MGLKIIMFPDFRNTHGGGGYCRECQVDLQLKQNFLRHVFQVETQILIVIFNPEQSFSTFKNYYVWVEKNEQT